MRVGLAVPAYIPAWDYGGVLTNARAIAGGLAKRGVDVQILTSTMLDAHGGRIAVGDGMVEGVPVHRMKTRWAYRWAPWVEWTMPEGAVDVLHVFGVWNGFSYSAMRWARGAGVRCLWEPSGMLAICGRKKPLKRLLSARNLSYAKMTDGIVWTSQVERGEAPTGFEGIRHWMRPNPVPELEVPEKIDRREARRRLGMPVDGRIYGYLGRIAERKGVDTLLDAWGLAETNASLELAGPCESAELERRMLALSGHRVRWSGSLRNPELNWFLSAIDALVIVPDCGENFGIVVVEALQAGTPVLASDAVGAGEWLGGCGVQIVPRDAAGLAQVLSAGTIPADRPRIPESLTVAALTKRMQGIYRDILQD